MKAQSENNIRLKPLSPGEVGEAVLLMDVPVGRKLDRVQLLPADGDESAAFSVPIK